MKTISLNERSVAYARMADALEHLGDTWRGWPDLATCADAMGLSPHHFQREFTRWAGLSPKQYQAALAHGADTAYEVGLSGPGRLHDLFIAHEGLTPGEAKAGGKGAELTLGRAPTPFGLGAWLTGPRGLIALGFIDDGAPERSGFEHQGRKPASRLTIQRPRNSPATCSRMAIPCPWRSMARRFEGRFGERFWKSRPEQRTLMEHSPKPPVAQKQHAPWAQQWAQIR